MAARAAIREATRRQIDELTSGKPHPHDERALAAAVAVLTDTGKLDPDTIELFDRMLRHPNRHTKWALLEIAPDDERLIPAMIHDREERWSWQETAARAWLGRLEGTPAYEGKSSPQPVGLRLAAGTDV